jgi:S-adenosylmethionine/arginine decarboxylase-like enzyme
MEHTNAQSYSTKGSHIILYFDHASIRDDVRSDDALLVKSNKILLGKIVSSVCRDIGARIVDGPIVCDLNEKNPLENRVFAEAPLAESLADMQYDPVKGSLLLSIYTCGKETNPRVMAYRPDVLQKYFNLGSPYIVTQQKKDTAVTRGDQSLAMENSHGKYNAFLIDGFDVNQKNIADPISINAALKKLHPGAIAKPHYTPFDVQDMPHIKGYTGFVIGHDFFKSIHTYPESKYVSVDLMLFHGELEADDVRKIAGEAFGTKNVIVRGYSVPLH